jgi:hypothetical protein
MSIKRCPLLRACLASDAVRSILPSAGHVANVGFNQGEISTLIAPVRLDRGKQMRHGRLVVLMAVFLCAAAPNWAQAQLAPVLRPVAHPGIGPYVVGFVGLSALSVIARSFVVSKRFKRELTPEEAADAVHIPFLWAFGGNASSNFGAFIKPHPVRGHGLTMEQDTLYKSGRRTP